jgi:hypothetical protein
MCKTYAERQKAVGGGEEKSSVRVQCIKGILPYLVLLPESIIIIIMCLQASRKKHDVVWQHLADGFFPFHFYFAPSRQTGRDYFLENLITHDASSSKIHYLKRKIDARTFFTKQK